LNFSLNPGVILVKLQTTKLPFSTHERERAASLSGCYPPPPTRAPQPPIRAAGESPLREPSNSLGSCRGRSVPLPRSFGSVGPGGAKLCSGFFFSVASWMRLRLASPSRYPLVPVNPFVVLCGSLSSVVRKDLGSGGSLADHRWAPAGLGTVRRRRHHAAESVSAPRRCRPRRAFVSWTIVSLEKRPMFRK